MNSEFVYCSLADIINMDVGKLVLAALRETKISTSAHSVSIDILLIQILNMIRNYIFFIF